jgi:uncharacterized protein involved in exopolysaccharide biosynthesis
MNRILYGESSISMLVRSVIRRWKPAVRVFAVSFATILLLAILLPSRYASHLKILVKNERANSLISVGEQTQGVLYLNDVSEARINTEIELLNSNDLLRKVVRRCALANLVSSRITSAEKREEIAVKDLQNAMTVASAHRSDVIEVTYKSGDPKRSAQVLQAVSDIYLSSHLELHGAPGSYAFFDKMWKDASDQLNAAEAELAEFRESAHIVSLPEEKNVLLEHVADLQNQLASTVAAAKKSQQEANSYKDSIAHMSTSVERERRSIPNQAATEQLGTLLVSLQNKRSEAITRYRPEDRIISELDAQIKHTQDAIDKANSSPAEEVASGANPTFVSAEGEFVRANAGYAGSVAQAGSLQRQIRFDQDRLEQLGAATVSYNDLVRRTSELSSLRETYRKNRDEANVGELLDKQKFSNVAIVERPVAENIASSPRRGIIAALGFIWSLVLAAITAVILEFMNKRIFSPFELEQALSVPMLAAVPCNTPLPLFVGEFPELYLAMQRTNFLPALEAK